MEGNLALTTSYRQKLADEIARGIRGLRAPINRPISPGSAASSEVLPQSASGAGFRSRDAARKEKIISPLQVFSKKEVVFEEEIEREHGAPDQNAIGGLIGFAGR